MARRRRAKGRLEEILSKALYADDPMRYTVVYRDYEKEVEVPLPEMIELSDGFQIIPLSRVLVVKRDGRVLYANSRIAKKSLKG